MLDLRTGSSPGARPGDSSCSLGCLLQSWLRSGNALTHRDQLQSVCSRGLADMNGDGKMDINEFSVACKLINLRLKGMEMPKSLPPQLLQSGNSAAMGMMQPPNSLALGGGMGMSGEYPQLTD